MSVKGILTVKLVCRLIYAAVLVAAVYHAGCRFCRHVPVILVHMVLCKILMKTSLPSTFVCSVAIRSDAVLIAIC